MATDKNLSLARRLFDEVYNKGNLSALDEIVATNVIIHDPALTSRLEGLKGYKETESQYTRAFPNKKIKIDDIFASADNNTVLVRWTCQGTHKGDFRGIPATNKDFKISGISVYKFSNGKITEINQIWDRLGLLEQIGEIQMAHSSR